MNMHAFCFPIREVRARGRSASSNAAPPTWLFSASVSPGPSSAPGFQIPRKARIMATLFQFNPFHIRGETYMAKIHWGLACLLLFVTAAVAQEHYTEGPVWRVTLVRVKPAQMDAYLTSACVKPPSHYSRRKNVRE